MSNFEIIVIYVLIALIIWLVLFYVSGILSSKYEKKNKELRKSGKKAIPLPRFMGFMDFMDKVSEKKQMTVGCVTFVVPLVLIYICIFILVPNQETGTTSGLKFIVALESFAFGRFLTKLFVCFCMMVIGLIPIALVSYITANIISLFIKDLNSKREVEFKSPQDKALWELYMLIKQKDIAEIVNTSPYHEVREAALKRLHNQVLIADIAKGNGDMNKEALKYLTKKNLLREVAKNALDESVRNTATEMLKSI